MFILPSPEELRQWQIFWYTKRYNECTDTKARLFLMSNLKNF